MNEPAALQSGLKHEELTSKIIGAFFDVYNELGFGFLEDVYEQALAIALFERGMKAERQFPIPVWFHARRVGDYKADILVDDRIVVELKAARSIDSKHEAQLLHYLKATEFEVGLLLNFGISPQFRRLLFDNDRKKIRENLCESVAQTGC
jgi:GxxExxY protein